MQNQKRNKLYKSGKLWIVGAVSVAGVMVTAGVSQVHADTVYVNDGTSTGTSQPSTQPSETGSTTLPPANSGTSNNESNAVGSGSFIVWSVYAKGRQVYI